MKKLQLKTKISTIALILVLTISAILVTLPSITAQVATVNPHPYINAVPNPVQVNNPTLFHVGIVYPGRRGFEWRDLTVEVTTPSGGTEILGPLDTDSTGGTGIVYTPTMVGIYTIRTHFPEQVKNFSDSRSGPEGTIMEDTYSESLELIVQEEALPFYPGHPLPTEYWTRPISGEIREWNVIAAHWLETVEPTSNAPPSINAPMRAFNAYAPETGHVLFRKPLAMGGLAGGVTGEHGFEQGDAYEGKFNGIVILGGVLFYNQHDADGGATVEQEVVAVDLHTGEELWRRPLIDGEGNNDRLDFGQAFYWDSYNYHGVIGYLWTTSGRTWNAFDPFSGRWVYGMENVSSGTRIRGPKGEIFIYRVDKNDGYMTFWNSSRVVSDQGSWMRRGKGSMFDGNDGYEWNVTIPELSDLPGSVYKMREGMIIGTDFQRGGLAPQPANMWAISVDYENGQAELAWHKTWQLPLDLFTITVEDVNEEQDLFIVSSKETMQTWGFRLSTGQEIWGPTPQRHYTDNWGHSSGNSWDIIVEDKVIAGNYGGTVWCYDAQTGDVEWTYDIVDPYTEILHNNRWRFRPCFVADGKLYLENTEHNPRDPMPRGAPILCLDLETGELIWQMPYRQGEWSSYMVIGDSIIVCQNMYDQHIYAIGKGPSKTTVTANPEISVHGSSVMIRGTVLDVSPGTEDPTIKIRFPNGVPAVSDADMTNWMTYVYNQFPQPMASGVTVMVEAIDPNNNYQYLGTTTTDLWGNFGMMYEPEVSGEYMIFATFQGTDSYYQSSASTYFGVDPAASPATPIEPEEPTELEEPVTPEEPDEPETPTEPEESEEPDALEEPTAAFITTELAIILAVIAVAVIGIVGYLVLKKRK